MAEAARPVGTGAGQGNATGRSKRSAAASARTPVLDPAIVAVMTLNADLQRVCARQLKTLWRKKGLSERGLFILELVNAGLDRPSRLIEYFDVLPSTITFETDKLVSSGLLVRESVPSDRRVVRLSLTDQGRAVHAEVTSALNGLLQPRLKSLAPDELRAFLATFRKIVDPIDPPAADAGAINSQPARPRRTP